MAIATSGLPALAGLVVFSLVQALVAQAALGLAQVERADELVERKREIFGWYAESLRDVAVELGVSGMLDTRETEVGGRLDPAPRNQRRRWTPSSFSHRWRRVGNALEDRHRGFSFLEDALQSLAIRRVGAWPVFDLRPRPAAGPQAKRVPPAD